MGGKVEGGALRAGTKMLLLPGGEAGSVRSLEVGGAAAALGRAGDSVEVVLAGIDTTNICAGGRVSGLWRGLRRPAAGPRGLRAH